MLCTGQRIAASPKCQPCWWFHWLEASWPFGLLPSSARSPLYSFLLPHRSVVHLPAIGLHSSSHSLDTSSSVLVLDSTRRWFVALSIWRPVSFDKICHLLQWPVVVECNRYMHVGLFVVWNDFQSKSTNLDETKNSGGPRNHSLPVSCIWQCFSRFVPPSQSALCAVPLPSVDTVYERSWTIS